MPTCEITSDFLPADCIDLESGGVSGDLYLINWNDWLTATKTVDGVTKEISAITITNTGNRAYKYELTRGASVVTSPLTVNNGGKSGYLHTILTFIPTKDQAVKAELTKLINFGRVVAIVVLDSSVVANVYGNDVGLAMTAFEEAPNDPAKGGGLQPTFSTPADTTLENLPGITFFNTDRATTVAALEALLTPAP